MDLVHVSVDEDGVVTVADVSGAGCPPLTVKSVDAPNEHVVNFRVGIAVQRQLGRINLELANAHRDCGCEFCPPK